MVVLVFLGGGVDGVSLRSLISIDMSTQQDATVVVHVNDQEADLFPATPNYSYIPFGPMTHFPTTSLTW